MKNIKLSFPKINFKKDGKIFGFGTSPEADWKIILVSTTILLVGVLALCAFIFIKIDKGEIFVVKKPTDETEKTLDINLLKETIIYYQNRKAEFDRVKGTVVPALDPSL
jgi:hypothetical protein